MTSTVSLSNPGLIPMEAVTTMGVSAKEGENPIGFFGTGLKYAIASLLRTSHKITIWRGLDRFDFAKEPGEVRGKEFDFIRMTGPDGSERLGFTTHLGAHWETWQVFREVYSNCLDEEGVLAFKRVEPQAGRTTIWVTGAAFAGAARERDKFFLSSEPLFKSTLVEVHPGRSDGIYYRGVLVARFGKTGAYTYNLTASMTLTEDRTLKEQHYAFSYIAHALANCPDAALLEAALTNVGGLEGDLSFNSPCAAFSEAVMALCERRGVAAVLQSAVKAAELWAQREARVKPANLSEREEDEIEDAKMFLARIGYEITQPIVVAETLGPDVFGMAKNETIYLARLTINRGGNFLIGTILEEHLHLTQGFRDESRRFQDFLIDLVVKFAKDAAHTRTPRAPQPAFMPVARELEEIPF
ncbi:hypothetical protein [Phenylobacterium sp.]|uniref:hypothetical protein n=1 Tax=Phenylobacterium sp. TaxID=1871053 RepID=UPI002737A491|nr:hypothetical protein [Phenylobacterium sp.]MDP3869148.1 hypothetical protein [Phenylobacterium sp.]